MGGEGRALEATGQKRKRMLEVWVKEDQSRGSGKFRRSCRKSRVKSYWAMILGVGAAASD